MSKKVSARPAVPAEPVEVQEAPVIDRPCVYAWLCNNQVGFTPGDKPVLEGGWYVYYIDPSAPGASSGPFAITNQGGTQYTGYTEIETLREAVRAMYPARAKLAIATFDIVQNGIKVMSCLVWKD